MFFPLAKILWFIAQPSSLIAAVLIAGAILVRSERLRRAGKRLLLYGLVALVVAGLTPLGDFLIWPLEMRFSRPDLSVGRPVTGLIVLGGAADGEADTQRELAALNDAAERYTEVAALARRFPEARVVFSGGAGTLLRDAAPEAKAAGRLLEALGIAKGRITLEDRSRNTFENAVFSRQLINPKPGERWLLITSGWHTPRAMGCFRKAGFAVEAWPVDYRTREPLRIVQLNAGIPEGLGEVDLAAREYIGLLVYYLTGRSSALFPAPS